MPNTMLVLAMGALPPYKFFNTDHSHGARQVNDRQCRPPPKFGTVRDCPDCPEFAEFSSPSFPNFKTAARDKEKAMTVPGSAPLGPKSGRRAAFRASLRTLAQIVATGEAHAFA